MGTTLNTNVTVHHPETGESATIPQGTSKSDLPSEVVDLIKNPHVWDEPDKEEKPVPGPSQLDVFDPDSDEAKAKASTGDTGSPFGTGSFGSRSATQVKALAEAHGLDHDTKDEAIAALDAAGITPDSPEPERPTSTDTNVEP